MFMKNNVAATLLVLAVFIVLGVAVYSNTFQAPFEFDSIARVQNNPSIRITELTFESIYNASFGKRTARNRPLGNLSFALNYYFHAYKMPGYHVVNITIHILAGIILFFFIRLTFNTPALSDKYKQSFYISFFATLIWLVHPLHTQSVTYIVQRLNSMAAMFYVLSLLLYVKGRLLMASQVSIEVDNTLPKKHKSTESNINIAPYLYFSGAIVAWILSLGCKQITVTLPFFILLYEWLFFKKGDSAWIKRSWKYVCAILIVLGVVVFIYLGANPLERLTSFNDYAKNEFTYTQRTLTQPRVVIHYLSLLAYPNPNRLNLDYDFLLSNSLIDPVTTLLSLLLIFGLIGLAIYLLKRDPLISFCILWYFGNLVIESSFLPLAVIFEHRTYLPSMPIFLIPVVLLYRYVKLKWLNISIVCSAVALFSVWTFQRNAVWADKVTLWQDTADKSPYKVRPVANLGEALVDQERYDEAIDYLRNVMQIMPDSSEIHNNLGSALSMIDDYEGARQHYETALQLKPNSKQANNNMGVLMNEIGRPDEALRYFQAAIEIDPQFDLSHAGMGESLSEMGKSEEAIQYYRTAIRLNPGFVGAYNNLAIELSRQGKTAEAIEIFEKALEIKPEYYEAYQNMGVELANVGKTDEAIQLFKKSLEINSEYTEARMSLGVALKDSGKLDEAIEEWLHVLRIEPEHARANYNLGVAMTKKGKNDEAIAYFTKAVQGQEDFADAHNNLGSVLIQDGKVDAAIYHFQETLRIDPDHVDARNNLVKARRILKVVEYDIATLKGLQQKEPDNPIHFFKLGNLYYDIGRWNDAADEFEKTIELAPDFIQAVNNLGLAYKRQAKYEKALLTFQTMIKNWPEIPAVYYNIACVYALQNDVDASIEWLSKAISNGYNNWELIKTDRDLENIRETTAYKELVKKN